MVHRIESLLDSCCLVLTFNNRLQLHESLFDGWFAAHMIMKYVSLVQLRIPAKLNSHSGQREHPDP